ncbi:hypothetical protein NECAME_05477 [Necator americanus]|uniref:Uncharacterized protein n=1 Tax=Necator americanus TaxID=51031 RepID=W2SJ53_NECAM|nr:hypothetical protein NECAME_05477 [Necator americanus]ETN68752.1 hypothetical protein NECAME_05477 [Necator americanus]
MVYSLHIWIQELLLKIGLIGETSRKSSILSKRLLLVMGELCA